MTTNELSTKAIRCILRNYDENDERSINMAGIGKVSLKRLRSELAKREA